MSSYQVSQSWLGRGNLPEQFRDKTKFLILLKAFVQELQAVSDVFEDLKTLRNFEDMEGAQLDGLGEIVGLKRLEISDYYEGASTDIYDDEYYRLFLIYKNILNNTKGRYSDIIKALKLMFNPQKINYSQTLSAPATLSINIQGDFTAVQQDLIQNARVVPALDGVKVQLSYSGTLFFGFGDLNSDAVGFGQGPFAHSVL